MRLLPVEHLPVEKHAALGGNVDAGQQVEDGGLARAVGADEPGELARVQPEVEVLHGPEAAEGYAESPCLEDGLHLVFIHWAAASFPTGLDFFPPRLLKSPAASLGVRSSENSYAPKMPFGRNMMMTISTSA